MKEKCLNLIELSVKEHKKFPLYESIVDEIINYVSENAEIVVNNIKDEEVLNSYILLSVSLVLSFLTLLQTLGGYPSLQQSN